MAVAAALLCAVGPPTASARAVRRYCGVVVMAPRYGNQFREKVYVIRGPVSCPRALTIDSTWEKDMHTGRYWVNRADVLP